MKIGQYQVTPLENILLGVDGMDSYLLVSDRKNGINTNKVKQDFREHFYRDYTGANTAGAYFCHDVSVFSSPTNRDCIVVVHHRYDV